MSLTERLAGIFEDVFGLEREKFAPNLGPDDVPNWDSIGHMNLVMRLEQEYGLRFEVDDITEMSTAGKILDILRAKGIEA
jgi:acyl carrier protein